jgi:hypothetical protein
VPHLPYQVNENTTRRIAAFAAIGSVVALWAGTAWAQADLPSRFSNQGSVSNTRHNLTQRNATGFLPSGSPIDLNRNDYGEVCVYCHTPHGGNSAVTLPLWNRTIKATAYTTYAALGSSSLTQPVSQPGPNSLSCLSCHDGQVAMDSIINMPGSGGYDPVQARIQNDTFLRAWDYSRGLQPTQHIGGNVVANQGCLACHSSGAGIAGPGASHLSVFLIGTDLRNDHPVGVRYPAARAGIDYHPPRTTRDSVRWFDTDGDNWPDSNEVRLYDRGDGFSVECASCHDPHGVPSGIAGGPFNRSFLRVRNTASALCLTCHIK